MSNQTELIERFLLACRQNPNTPTPPELDADMAAFIRQLAQRSYTPDAAVRHRVWQKAWHNAKHGQKQLVHHNLDTTETTKIIHTPFQAPSGNTYRTTGGLAFIATLLLIFVVMFTAWKTLPFASQLTITPTPTLSQTPTFVPTSTPLLFDPQPENGTPFPTVPPPDFIIKTSTPVP